MTLIGAMGPKELTVVACPGSLSTQPLAAQQSVLASFMEPGNEATINGSQALAVSANNKYNSQ